MHTSYMFATPAANADSGLTVSQTREGLHPFPEGWYLVTTRETLRREKLIEKQWMGVDIVAWCDEEGLVFAWYELGGRPAHWFLPDDPPAGSEWGDLGYRTLRFRSHPQETAENSVDIGHLRYVHGYDNVIPIGSVTVEGAYLKS